MIQLPIKPINQLQIKSLCHVGWSGRVRRRSDRNPFPRRCWTRPLKHACPKTSNTNQLLNTIIFDIIIFLWNVLHHHLSSPKLLCVFHTRQAKFSRVEGVEGRRRGDGALRTLLEGRLTHSTENTSGPRLLQVQKSTFNSTQHTKHMIWYKMCVYMKIFTLMVEETSWWNTKRDTEQGFKP